jgi:hypothetical protein
MFLLTQFESSPINVVFVKESGHHGLIRYIYYSPCLSYDVFATLHVMPPIYMYALFQYPPVVMSQQELAMHLFCRNQCDE